MCVCVCVCVRVYGCVCVGMWGVWDTCSIMVGKPLPLLFNVVLLFYLQTKQNTQEIFVHPCSSLQCVFVENLFNISAECLLEVSICIHPYIHFNIHIYWYTFMRTSERQSYTYIDMFYTHILRSLFRRIQILLKFLLTIIIDIFFIFFQCCEYTTHWV